MAFHDFVACILDGTLMAYFCRQQTSIDHAREMQQCLLGVCGDPSMWLVSFWCPLRPTKKGENPIRHGDSPRFGLVSLGHVVRVEYGKVLFKGLLKPVYSLLIKHN